MLQHTTPFYISLTEFIHFLWNHSLGFMQIKKELSLVLHYEDRFSTMSTLLLNMYFISTATLSLDDKRSNSNEER